MDRQVLLTLDVEEFDIPEEYGQEVPAPERIGVSAEGLAQVFGLLDGLGIPATCFTTVYFAQNRPVFLERILERHELASHGFIHSSFRKEDLLRSRLALERMSGQRVYGFRMPRFGPLRHRDVEEAGYTYNSSENPIWLPGRYMRLFGPRLPYFHGSLLNLPVSASPLIRYPLFWLSFKNSPLSLFKKISRWTLEKDGYLNIFFHPWEFSDLSAWRLPAMAKRLSGKDMLAKLEAYLAWLIKSGAEFTTCSAFAERFTHAAGRFSQCSY